ncbi:response regulator transcription factor [Leeia sp. TBRC 13508]|uniref:Response regulator transcription factor n=1 Tax=Leeia speluncae TaxID=2884804 RepID=A0ABS8D5I9_9NEIS|nr:response regulator transcription factor [Leeia speluncae]MCB6183454.1 response regulator transcription factor [Leeia speluncae]
MRIAVLEDDPSLCEMVCQTLQVAGHSVTGFQEGRRLLQNLKRDSFDLILLDWEVPDLSGIEALTWIRENLDKTLPIMFLTCRDAETDIVTGLNSGADDYMIKPAKPAELLARVNALIRRAYPDQGKVERLEMPPYRFDLTSRTAFLNDEAVELTQKEFDLVVILFRNLGRVLSRNHIQEVIWGHMQQLNSRSMDTHVSRVRNKLQLRPENGYKLSPVYSFGYRLEQVSNDA